MKILRNAVLTSGSVGVILLIVSNVADFGSLFAQTLDVMLMATGATVGLLACAYVVEALRAGEHLWPGIAAISFVVLSASLFGAGFSHKFLDAPVVADRTESTNPRPPTGSAPTATAGPGSPLTIVYPPPGGLDEYPRHCIDVNFKGTLEPNRAFALALKADREYRYDFQGQIEQRSTDQWSVKAALGKADTAAGLRFQIVVFSMDKTLFEYMKSVSEGGSHKWAADALPPSAGQTARVFVKRTADTKAPC
jgi:hypothetical protein